MLAWLWISLASAEDLSRFSHRAAATCPAQGQCRVEVPAELVARGPESLIAVDAQGQRVPFAVLRSAASPTHWVGASTAPTSDPRALALRRPTGTPVPLVRLQVEGDPFEAAVRVEARRAGQTDWTPGPWGAVAAGLVDEAPVELAVPDAGAEELRLVFDRPWTRLPAELDVDLGLRSPERLAPAIVEATLTATQTSRGSTTHELRLPSFATVTALELDVGGDVFRRPVAVFVPEARDDGVEQRLVGTDMVRRLMIGDARIDDVRVAGFETAAAELSVRIDDAPDPPLELRGVRVEVERRVLLLRDAGSITIYGGGDARPRPSDLQDAAGELSILAWQPAEVGPVVPNPAWVSLSSVEALLKPGATMDRGRFQRARPLAGQGLSRVPLPPDVFVIARQDLGDLRVLDAQGRQLPFILHRGVDDVRAEDLQVRAAEQERKTVLTLSPPPGGLAARGLTLSSSSSRFDRQITVYGIEEAGPRLLASQRWVGMPPGPQRLDVDLRWDFDGPVVVEVDHGDDAPIEVSLVGVWTPSAHLLVELPGDGAELVYGDASALRRKVRRGLLRELREPGWEEPVARPDYDVRMLADELTRRPSALVMPGALTQLASAEVDTSQQGLVLGAVALMVAGLGLALVRLLKHPPSPDHGQG